MLQIAKSVWRPELSTFSLQPKQPEQLQRIKVMKRKGIGYGNH